MTPLPPDLRTLLARAIQNARRVGEIGCPPSPPVPRRRPRQALRLHVARRQGHSATASADAAARPETTGTARPALRTSAASPTKSPTSTGTGCSSPASWPRTACSAIPSTGSTCRWTTAGTWPRKRTPTPGSSRAGAPGACCRRSSAATIRCFDLPSAARDAAGARRAAGRVARSRVHGPRFARLDLPVLAGRPEGRGQPRRREDRSGRTSCGHPALHRDLHGPLPAAQHHRRLARGQAAGRPPRPGRERQ